MVCNDCKLVKMAISIEYEGSISIGKHKSETSICGYSYQMMIQLSNTENGLLRWLVNDFGGSVSVYRRNDNHLDSGAWRLTGRNASSLLSLLIPFFELKRTIKLAELAIEFQKGQIKGVKRTDDRIKEQERLYLASKELNAVGNTSGEIIDTTKKSNDLFLGVKLVDLE